MDRRQNQERPRPARRRVLAIEVQQRGQFPVLLYEAPRMLGGTTPMSTYANNALGRAVVKVIEQYHELEAEVDPLLKRLDDQDAEIARLTGELESSQGMVNHLKGQVKQRGELVGSSPAGKGRR